MLLTIDVGNTHIKMQMMEGIETKAVFRLTTRTPRTSDEYITQFRSFLDLYDLSRASVDDVIISSVVPKIMYSLNSAVLKFFGYEPLIVGPGIRSGIEIRTENAKEVGADRIVDAAAAYYTYHRSCIVVDFGTATTFDYVSRDGVFSYTVIAPGVGICANALTTQTAKLPDIEIQKPASVLGHNTVTGMQAGVVYGYIGAVEYILKQMKKELKDPDAYVVATGGIGRVISAATDEIDAYDPNVAGIGMAIIYDFNKDKRKKIKA